MAALAQHVVLCHDTDRRRRSPSRRGCRRARGRSLDAGVGPRLTSRRDGEHDVALEPPRVLRPDDRLGLEALDLRGDADREVARVEGADPVDAASSGDRRVPGRLRVEPERGDGSETGDDDATHEAESVVASGHGPVAHGTREPVERPADLHPSIPFPPMEAELVRDLPDGRRVAVRAEVGRIPRLLENARASSGCGRGTRGRSSATSRSCGRSESSCHRCRRSTARSSSSATASSTSTRCRCDSIPPRAV